MRSPRVERRLFLARAVLAGACVLAAVPGVRAQDDGAAAAAASSAAASDAAPPDPRAARIEAAVDQLRTDPLLAGRHKEHRLHWKDDAAQKKPETPTLDLGFLDWLAAFARFINDTSRLLLWGLGIVLVALALVGLRHVVQLRAFRRNQAAAAVSHVRDLDVRPESLPDDVGAAAWALWQSRQVPAALSLLYRGALSRMIHRFQVPITASATEGECLALARGRLEPTALRYVTQVVRAWEANIYGGRALSDAMGELLCAGFGQRLDGRGPAAPQRVS
jgi:hypothetical protein